MKEGVKRYYEKRATTYEDLQNPRSIIAAVRDIGIRDHLQIMDTPEKSLILDVGCGQGRFLKEFNRIGRVVGVDFTIKMLENARGSGALLVRADAEHLPFKDKAFEISHSAGLLGIFHSARICREMMRVSARGCYIGFPALESLSGAVFRIVKRLGWNPTLLDYWYSKEDIHRIFPDNEVIIHRLGFEPPFQRLFKSLESTFIVRIFIILERNLRDKPLFRYLGGRYLVEVNV